MSEPVLDDRAMFSKVSEYTGGKAPRVYFNCVPQPCRNLWLLPRLWRPESSVSPIAGTFELRFNVLRLISRTFTLSLLIPRVKVPSFALSHKDGRILMVTYY
jgi:hypothetical protein